MNLPEELLNIIVKFIPLKSINNISMINKLFSNIDWQIYIKHHNPLI